MTDRLPHGALHHYSFGRALIPMQYVQSDPTRKGKKQPRVRWKHRIVRPDLDELNIWARRWPDSLWAAMTGIRSDMFTLDFDGEVGAATLARLSLEPHRITPGGFHVDFTDPDFEVRSITQNTETAFTQAFPGVDVRGEGGLIVVYGTTPFGTYEQVRPLDPDPFDLLPEDLLDHIRRIPRKCSKVPRPTTRKESPIPMPTSSTEAAVIDDITDRLLRSAQDRLDAGAARNDTGFWLACQLRDWGVPQHEAEATMVAYHSTTPDTDATGALAPYAVEEAMASLESAYSQLPREPAWGPPDGIIVNDPDKQESELVNEALHRLAESNTQSPRLFEQQGTLVRIRTDDRGHDLIEPLTPDLCRAELAARIDWYTAKYRDDDQPTFQAANVPAHLVRQVPVADRSGLFPRLTGIITAPTILTNGDLVTDPGFHEGSGLWLAPGALGPVTVPDKPTPSEVDHARTLILDTILGEFPFDGESSKANAAAFLLTAIAPDSFTGRPPIILVNAHQAGSGKSYLVEVIHTAAAGHVSMATPPDREEEFRKAITSIIIEGKTLLALDNLATTLSSPILAQLATAPYWGDRMLGRNKTVQMANRLLISVTGNNIAVGGDIARRCVYISLDPRHHRPWERSFQNPHLVTWIAQNRHTVIGAALTLITAWHNAGQPQAAHRPVLGGFQGWADSMAGVLDHAGINGFLGNAEIVHSQADQEATAWAALLHTAHDWFEKQEGGTFTTTDFARQIGAMLNRLEADAPTLPPKVAYALDAEEHARGVRLGRLLASQANRRFDASGIRIEKALDLGSNANRYRIIKDPA